MIDVCGIQVAYLIPSGKTALRSSKPLSVLTGAYRPLVRMQLQRGRSRSFHTWKPLSNIRESFYSLLGCCYRDSIRHDIDRKTVLEKVNEEMRLVMNCLTQIVRHRTTQRDRRQRRAAQAATWDQHSTSGLRESSHQDRSTHQRVAYFGSSLLLGSSEFKFQG